MSEDQSRSILRARSQGGPPIEEVTITFDGNPVTARVGETIAAALTAAGLNELRETQTGAQRGMFCGMGVCQECLVEVDGRNNRRACMTVVTGPMEVRSGSARSPANAAPTPAASVAELKDLTPEILVIGGGAAGLSAAAVAAETGAEVLVLDERPAPGGQYYKQPASLYVTPDAVGTDRQFEGGRQLLERARHAGVRIVSGAEVWGAFAPLEITALTPDGPVTIRPQKLIVATGAYERALPVPGWTLPGVMTTGAAQTLLRSYRTLAGKRVFIAGNGPLNLQVGVELARAGAEVAGIAEASQMSLLDIGALGRMALSAPGLCLEGLGYLAGLRRRGIPVHRGEVLLRVDPSESGLRVTTGHWNQGIASPVREITVDALCMGYGFMPSNEILRLLGARHDYDLARGQLVTRRSDTCETSVPDLYAVGDCCGLGGARAAVEDGIIAGLAAISSLRGANSDTDRRIARSQRERDRQQRFQSALWRLFSAPRLTTELCDDDTLVCRCEEVTFGTLRDTLDGEPGEIGSVKRCSRAGMGRCQGRYCAPNLAAMIAQRAGTEPDELSFFAPRPPIKPVTIADITAGVPPVDIKETVD